mgnify:CR=1 FL=1|tara:strand:- start:543 stop:989 length:447 start_codon:yes stop_codon:yes gene_type:complete
MFNIFKKNKKKDRESLNLVETELELTALVLAYEVARSDGEILESELEVLLKEINKVAITVGKKSDEILKILENFSKNSISFHEFIEDINKKFNKNDKLLLLSFLWEIAYADSILEVDEEKLIRRIADLIHIKDMEVLKIKDNIKNKRN